VYHRQGFWYSLLAVSEKFVEAQMKRIYLLCALAMGAQLFGGPPNWGQETGFLNRTLKLEGKDYQYVVYVPRGWAYDKNKQWPVILFLHGYGEGGDEGIAPTEVGVGAAIRYHPERFPFVVVFPQFPWQHIWLEEASARKALAALDAEMKEFNGDPDRVYLTGLSMGGYGTWYIASHYPNQFAAIAPMAGGIRASWAPKETQAPDIYNKRAAQIGMTSTWIFHGADDLEVSVGEARAMFEAMQRSGGNVRYYEYEGVGHDSWDKAYADPEFPVWLLQHRLSERSKVIAQAEKRVVSLAPKPAQVDPKIYDAYLGRYEYPMMAGTVYGLTIAREGNTLTVKGDDAPRFTLLSLSETKFWNANWGELVFGLDKASHVMRLLYTDPDARHTEVYVRVKVD
jgi:predicted esterase